MKSQKDGDNNACHLRIIIKAALSFHTAHEWMTRFYKEAGIRVKKASHAPRVMSTQNADMAGVAEGQVSDFLPR